MDGSTSEWLVSTTHGLSSIEPGSLPHVDIVPFPSWRRARDQACAVLLAGEKLVLVTGPTGTGKTLLLEDVARVLRSANWQVSFYVPGVPFERDLGANHGPSIMLVDDAERLTEADLLFLRLSKKRPVLLAGTEGLERSFPGSTTIKLETLGLEEARTFIQLWCAQAGERDPSLDEAAVLHLLGLSAGIPRLLAILLGAGSWRDDGGEQVAPSPRSRNSAAMASAPQHVVSEKPAENDPPAMPAPAANGPSGSRSRRWLAGGVSVAALLCIGGFMATRFDGQVPRSLSEQAGHVWAGALSLRDEVQNGSRQIAAAFETMTGRHNRAKPRAELAATQPRPASARPSDASAAVVPAPAPAIVTAAPALSVPARLPAAEQGQQHVPEPTPTPAPVPVRAEASPPPSREPVIAVPSETPARNASPSLAVPKIGELPPPIVEILLRRGSEMMALGDYSAARLLFGRAAESGSATAMLALGQTYDLRGLSGAGIDAAVDREAARRWYRQAQAAGSPDAAYLLRTLEQDGGK